jgi:hypothetical protein
MNGPYVHCRLVRITMEDTGEEDTEEEDTEEEDMGEEDMGEDRLITTAATEAEAMEEALTTTPTSQATIPTAKGALGTSNKTDVAIAVPAWVLCAVVAAWRIVYSDQIPPILTVVAIEENQYDHNESISLPIK